MVQCSPELEPSADQFEGLLMSSGPTSPGIGLSLPAAGLELGHGTSQSCEAATGSPRNQFAGSRVNQGALLLEASKLASPTDQLIVEVQACPHTHQYRLLRQTSQRVCHQLQY